MRTCDITMWEMNLLTTLAVTGRYKTSKFDFFSEINWGFRKSNSESALRSLQKRPDASWRALRAIPASHVTSTMASMWASARSGRWAHPLRRPRRLSSHRPFGQPVRVGGGSEHRSVLLQRRAARHTHQVQRGVEPRHLQQCWRQDTGPGPHLLHEGPWWQLDRVNE